MKILFSQSVSKIDAGQRVAAEFAKNDWSIGTVEKTTPTGYKIAFDYGETKLVKTSAMRVILVDRKARLKKSLTFAELKVFKPVAKAKTTVQKTEKNPVAKIKPAVTPAHIKPTIKITAPVVPNSNPIPPQHTERDTKEELALEHLVGNPELFKVAQHGAGGAKLVYMKHVWSISNRLFFSQKLVLPKLGFLKLMKNFRGLGQWNSSTRGLRVSPRMFNATEAHVTATLVHEMCHQAVSEIDHVNDRTQGGHGPDWVRWMRHCKLDPNRYNKNDTTDFMTSTEKLEHKRLLENHKAAVTAPEAPKKLMYLRNDTPAQFFDPRANKWYSGLIVDKHDLAGKRWCFIMSPTYTSWKILPTNLLCELPKEQHQNYLTNEFLAAAAKVRAYKERKLEGRRSKASLRKDLRAYFD